MNAARTKSPASRRRVSLVALASVALAICLLSAAPAYAEPPCPNEALRTENNSLLLPDCRAYEQVSPPYKQGAFISSRFALSADGSHFIAGSLGAFGATEGDALGQGTSIFGAAYEFIRDPLSGWTPAALDPPRSKFRVNGLFDASADLTSTLWELGTRQPTQVEALTDFYLERPRGTFTRIGPATPDPALRNANHYTYLGASADLNHIFFSVDPGLRWPFDETAPTGATLYGYAGTSNSKPELVGVSGGAGSTSLISKCGTRLGSSSPAPEEVIRSTYNAVSSAGDRVFFTAVGADEPGCSSEAPPVGELFSREELPSGEMRTVPISEPAQDVCALCELNAPAADAVFAGASLDGSKVFFTTRQALLGTDSTQNLYEYDFAAPAGQRVTEISATNEPTGAQVQGVSRISEDGSHVYFVAQGILTGGEPNASGDHAQEGANNLYVYDTQAQQTSFIAALSSGDGADWAGQDSREVATSADGRYLNFVSFSDPAHEALSGTVPQIFQYDADGRTLVRASIGESGFNEGNRNPLIGSSIPRPQIYQYNRTDSPTAASAIQAPLNGTVFFKSPDALTPGALADQLDDSGHYAYNVYEYRAGNVYLLSDGFDTSSISGGSGVDLFGSDPSGADVLFLTSTRLGARDGDTQQDLYDARVGGGFAALPSPLFCSGEDCRLASAPPSAPVLYPTTTPSATGNLAPGRRRQHRHKRRHGSHHRRASIGRRPPR